MADVEALAGAVAENHAKLDVLISVALSLEGRGPAVIAVNPGSMLGTKMVKQAFGVAGADMRVGAEVLRRAAPDDDFADASGRYFDNDSGRFASPLPMRSIHARASRQKSKTRRESPRLDRQPHS